MSHYSHMYFYLYSDERHTLANITFCNKNSLKKNKKQLMEQLRNPKRVAYISVLYSLTILARYRPNALDKTLVFVQVKAIYRVS